MSESAESTSVGNGKKPIEINIFCCDIVTEQVLTRGNVFNISNANVIEVISSYEKDEEFVSIPAKLLTEEVRESFKENLVAKSAKHYSSLSEKEEK